MRADAIGLLCLLALAAPERPAFLDWDDDMPGGNPSITLSAGGAVSLTLPQATIDEAQAEGFDLADTVRLFLDRWAPRMCSDAAGMRRPNKALAVTLHVQRSAALEDADGETMEAAAEILNGGLAAVPRAVPRIRRAFVVDQTPQRLIVDYAPDGKVKCSEPKELLY